MMDVQILHMLNKKVKENFAQVLAQKFRPKFSLLKARQIHLWIGNENVSLQLLLN